MNSLIDFLQRCQGRPQPVWMVAAALVLVAGLALPQLKIDPRLNPESPIGRDPILLALATEAPWSQTTQDRLVQVSGRLRALPGVKTLTSPLDHADELKTSSLLRQLFLSRDGRAWTFYLNQSRPWLPADWQALQQVLDQTPGLHVFGLPYLEAAAETSIVTDFRFLSVLALGLLLVAVLGLTRRWRASFILVMGAGLPAVFVLAAFPLTGTALRPVTVLVPLLTLALATSYALHLYQAFRHPTAGASPLAQIAPSILLAGGVTAVGFAALLTSPMVELRTLGAFLVLGIGLALATTLLLIPGLLARAELRPPTSHWFNGSLPAPLAWGTLAVGLVVIGGCFFLRPGTGLEAAFWEAHPAERERQYFVQTYGGWNQLTLTLSATQDNQLLAPATFQAIADTEARAATRSDLLAIFSYTDLVKEVWSQTGPDRPSDPVQVTTANIAEALELAISPDSFWKTVIDARYRSTRLELWLADGTNPAPLTEALGAEFSRLGLSVQFSGAALATAETTAQVVQGQLSRLVLFFLIVTGLLMVVFRSPGRGFRAMIFPFLGEAFFCGLSGWLGWPLTMVSTLTLATVAGISVDNALALSQSQSAPAGTRRAVLETTGVFALLLGTLLLSSYRMIAQAGLLALASLLFSTILILSWLKKPEAPL